MGKRRRRKVSLRKTFGIALAVAAVICIGISFIGPKEYEKSELLEMGIPKSLANLYVRNEETRDFVLGYLDAEGDSDTIDIEKDLHRGEIPLFLQWDERWGYEKYGDDFMALEGCGPTCLSMVYCGLTGDPTMHPLAMAEMAEAGNHYVSGVGSAWTMMQDMATELGLTVNEVFFMADSIIEELQAGRPIICAVSSGDFTTEGHFIVLTEADDDGMLTVHDPNSKKNSKQKWDIETIMSQTENLWSYSYDN